MEQYKNSEFNQEKDRIASLLKLHGIDFVGKWGVGEAKTLNHLVEEILSGDSSLIQTPDGELIRVLETATGIVEYVDSDGIKLCLYENRQEFTDGRIRRRDYSKWSISEKKRPNETPYEAIKRAVNEELENISGFECNGLETMKDLSESHSFPGLKTQYTIHGFLVRILPESYRPEYIERQKDKITYFNWRNAE